MSIEALITDLTAAVRELTATLRQQPTPANEGESSAKRGPGRPRKTEAAQPPAEQTNQPAPTSHTAAAVVAAAPEKTADASGQPAEPAAAQHPASTAAVEVPAVATATEAVYFKDTTTGKPMVCEPGWPLPSMERLVRIDKLEYDALIAPKVAPVASRDTARAKLLLARDELVKRLHANGAAPDKAKEAAMEACKGVLAHVNGGVPVKLDELPAQHFMSLIMLSEQLVSNKDATSFNLPTDQEEL
jgi:hypothetical protein